MGLIDKLRKVGGILKNRLAGATTALRGITVSGARVRKGVRFAAKGSRLTSPLGLGLTAAAFAPEIIKGGRFGARFITKALGRGVAFFAGRQVTQAVIGGTAAGTVAGILTSTKRKRGDVVRPGDFGDPTLQTRTPGAPTVKRPRSKPTARRKPTKRRKARVKRTRVKRKRATHRSPRHKGHKLVKFTTKEGKKVSFLVNPKARHR